jgi:hypothetical protein
VLAELPALPLHTAGKYVAAAYIVVFAIVLIYVSIMAIRLSRIERDLGELLQLSENPEDGRTHEVLSEAHSESERESAPA